MGRRDLIALGPRVRDPHRRQRGLDAFQQALAADPAVGSAVGPTTVLRMVRYVGCKGDRLPDDPEELEALTTPSRRASAARRSRLMGVKTREIGRVVIAVILLVGGWEAPGAAAGSETKSAFTSPATFFTMPPDWVRKPVVYDEWFQTRYMERVFHEHLMDRLSANATEARIHFDTYVAAQNYSARLIVSQKNFFDYLLADLPRRRQGDPIRRLNDLPPWLPDASVLRAMVHFRYVLLFDAAVQVREVYQGWPDPFPTSLLQPSDLLRKLSSNQSYMTTVDGRPFLLTSEFAHDDTGRILGGIMIASRLDDFFLSDTKAASDERFPVALLSVDEPKVIASSSPQLKDMQKDFFIVGKSFFDSGASDLSIQFVSLTSKNSLHDVSASLLKQERWVSTLIATLFVFCGLLITFYFAGQLKVLTGKIVSFSKALFPEKSASAEVGNEIRILGREFDLFKESIVAARETVQRQTAELLQEKSQLQEALANIKVLKGLLPICALCKKVRDDTGYWTQIETYIRSRTDAEFTHGLCPECLQKFKKEITDQFDERHRQA